MKKLIFVISLSLTIMVGGLVPAIAQEEPKPKKDTVNIDTDAKPTFYYSVEDEKTDAKDTKGKSSAVTIAIIAGAVILVGAAAFFLLKKKK
jgi:LPXTG-motif cell wall-anchored protein